MTNGIQIANIKVLSLLHSKHFSIIMTIQIANIKVLSLLHSKHFSCGRAENKVNVTCVCGQRRHDQTASLPGLCCPLTD